MIFNDLWIMKYPEKMNVWYLHVHVYHEKSKHDNEFLY